MVHEYGEKGWSSDGMFGAHSWSSVIAVDLFVQSGDRYVRIPRFASRAFGSGETYEAPTRIASVNAMPTNGQRPSVWRPSDQPF